MKQVSKKIFLWVGLSFFVLSACGESPLLHHETAKNAAEAETKNFNEKSNPGTGGDDCPLSFSHVGLCASLEWVQLADLRGNATADATGTDQEREFILRFWEKGKGNSQTGPYVDPSQKVSVKLWMPSMGHGSAPVKIDHHKSASRQDEIGVFDVTQVVFIMSGNWEIRIQLKQDQKMIDEAIHPIAIP